MKKIIYHNVILAKKNSLTEECFTAVNYSLTEPGVHQFLVSLNSIENTLLIIYDAILRMNIYLNKLKINDF